MITGSLAAGEPTVLKQMKKRVPRSRRIMDMGYSHSYTQRQNQPDGAHRGHGAQALGGGLPRDEPLEDAADNGPHLEMAHDRALVR